MICKVAEPDVETEDLTWQPLGAHGSAGPPTYRPAASALAGALLAKGPAAARDAGSLGAASIPELDLEGMRQHVAELEAKRDSDLEQSRQNGFEQGLRQARQEAAKEMQEALDRLARAIQEVPQVKRRMRNEAENEVVKLSLAVARRILHREMTSDPQSLQGLVYAALQRLQNREITKIRVYPASVNAVRSALERNGGMAAIEISGDGALQPGALLFETSLGELDASVETQLQEIERGFADRLQSR
jgi:flagellar assembly protein FliH